MKSKLAIWSLVLPIISIVIFGSTLILLEVGDVQCGGHYGYKDDTFLCKFSTKNYGFQTKVATFNLFLTALSLIFGITAIKAIKRFMRILP